MDVKQALKQAVVIVSQKTEAPPSEIGGDVPPKSNLPDSLLTNFFKMDMSDVSKQDVTKMGEINDFLKSVGADDEMKKVEVLRDTRFRLGSPKTGMSSLNHVHKYIKLKKAAKTLETEAKAMEE